VPLSTFSSRIKAAYRLGLIDLEITRALDLIRRLRNDFAHKVQASTLTVSPHKDRVMELIDPLKGGSGYKHLKTIIGGKIGNPEPPAVDFRIALGVVASRLEEAIRKARPLSSDSAVGLLPPQWNA
jgi:hypothetical protein